MGALAVTGSGAPGSHRMMPNARRTPIAAGIQETGDGGRQDPTGRPGPQAHQHQCGVQGPEWSAKFGVTQEQLLADVKAGRRRRGVPEEGQEVGSRPVEPTTHPMTGRGLTLPARLPGKAAIRRADSRPSAPAWAQESGLAPSGARLDARMGPRTQLLAVVLRSDRQMSHQFPSSNLSTREGTASRGSNARRTSRQPAPFPVPASDEAGGSNPRVDGEALEGGPRRSKVPGR